MHHSKKNRRAVALNFEESSCLAPTVEARGSSESAIEMLRIARRYGVAIHQEAKLVDKLVKVPTKEQIPAELFDQVAQILVNTSKQSNSKKS